MKKILIFVLVLVCMLSSIISVHAVEYQETNQRIMYNGNFVNIEQPIVNISGSLYVPIRTFCEKIGYTVDWSREGISVHKKNESHYFPDAVYKYINDKTYISLRDLGKYINKNVDYDAQNGIALLNDKPLNHNSSKIIMIDPGHGNQDPGAVGNGVEEKDVNLKISLIVRDKLVADGYTVIMTREDDTFLSLSERSDYANSVNADLFISIHNNSADNSTAKGTEVLCNFSTSSKDLAENILNEIVKRIDTTNRGLKDGSKMAVIRKTNMPAVIVEGLFISNSSDAKKLKDNSVIEKIADGIYVGIKKSM